MLIPFFFNQRIVLDCNGIPHIVFLKSKNKLLIIRYSSQIHLDYNHLSFLDINFIILIDFGTYIGFHIKYCCISKRWHQKRSFWHENRFCYYAFPNHFCFPKVVTVWFMILINQSLFHSNKTYSFGKSSILFEHPPF